ncbi:MAG: site-2 protease family protein [Myxococcales bacterium]|nr:site-2 protease family protein [Myxococcales bacterium]
MFVGDGRHPLDRQFRVGVFFGIPLYIHIILVIFVGIEAVMALAQMNPLRLLFPALLFGSVYLHELGHALSSAAFGNRPRRIVMHLFGGVAEVPPGLTRKQELWVIAWGPLVSLALAVLGGVFYFTPVLGSIPILKFIANYLFTLNAILFVFNILPIFPLDGGQFLRQFLTLRRGESEGIRRSLPLSMLLLAILGIYSLFSQMMFAFIIAIFVFMVNYNEWQRWQHLFQKGFWIYLWPFGGKKKGKGSAGPSLGDRFFVWRHRAQAEKLMRVADEEGIHKLKPQDRKLLEDYLDAKLRLRPSSRIDIN